MEENVVVMSLYILTSFSFVFCYFVFFIERTSRQNANKMNRREIMFALLNFHCFFCLYSHLSRFLSFSYKNVIRTSEAEKRLTHKHIQPQLKLGVLIKRKTCTDCSKFDTAIEISEKG